MNYRFSTYFFTAITLFIVLSCNYGEFISRNSPYPPSPVVATIQFDWSTHQRQASGSDNWPITWADDNHQYTSWGDGGGFGGSGRDGRVSLGIAKVIGPREAYQGNNVWGGHQTDQPATFSGKSYGILSVKGILYLWVSPGSNRRNYREARLYSSDDHGQTWQAADWAFTQADGLILPTFLQFGQDYQGARDEYTYIYTNYLRQADALSIQKPGEIALIRVPTTQILTRDRYEFFAGYDRQGNPRWTGNIKARQPVFQDPDQGVGWTTSVSYNPGLNRYFLMTEHGKTAAGYLGLFDAPEPWGPWTTVQYTHQFGVGHIPQTTFFYNFSNKWLSEDGLNAVLIFTGIQDNDSWNTVEGRFSRLQR